MTRIAITGSASGIGRAARKRLEAEGAEVIGVDLRDADVPANLADPAGRTAAIDGVVAACGGVLDGLVACAGVGPESDPLAEIVSINYFGAHALVAGLRPALAAAGRSSVVVVSSNSSALPGIETPMVDACLAGDETTARRLAGDLDGFRVYAGSKLALARWMRRSAPEWVRASGIRMNAVAPGAVKTPLLQRGLDHPAFGAAIRDFPIPTGSFGAPDEIASAIAFLLGPEASFCCGSVVFVDGGTDAMLRPDAY